MISGERRAVPEVRRERERGEREKERERGVGEREGVR